MPGLSNANVMLSSMSTADRVGPQSLRTVRGSSSVFVQVTTAPALIVKNMGMNKNSLITLSEIRSKPGIRVRDSTRGGESARTDSETDRFIPIAR
jgi:hypothetical protein